MIYSKIAGTGRYLPEKILTNADLEKMVDTTDEWIRTRTGVERRHVASEDQTTSDLCVEAAKKAMESANVTPDDIDLIIVGTTSPDLIFPNIATIIQDRMGIHGCPAFSIEAACTGFIYALSTADKFVRAGEAKCALIIGAEIITKLIDWSDRSTCVLFGDGAGAAVVSAEESDSGIISTYIKSDGSYKELLWIKVGSAAHPYTPDTPNDGMDKILMNGADIFKIAVKKMGDSAKHALEQANVTSDDIALVIPHQANIRIIEALAKRIKIDMSKVFLNIEKYGNTSAASVPLALDEANRKGLIKEGDNILMVAFGGGLIWGSTLIKW